MILSFLQCRAHVHANIHVNHVELRLLVLPSVKIASLAIDMSCDRNFVRMVCESSIPTLPFFSHIFWVLAICLFLSQMSNVNNVEIIRNRKWDFYS